jgi:hypothetical protein
MQTDFQPFLTHGFQIKEENIAMFRHTRKKHIARAVLVLSISICGLTNAWADKITDWNLIANTAENNIAGRGNPFFMVDLAYMHIAMYDAVNGIDHRYTTFAVTPTNVPAGAAKDAAAVEAGYRVFRAIIPSSQYGYVDAQYALSMSSISDSQAKEDGKAVGAEVAALFLASRAGDGRNNPAITYIPCGGMIPCPTPGVWVPTWPNFPSASTPWLAVMRPFAIESPSQFRADPPPALDSAEYLADLDETRRVGSLNSTERTSEQTDLARFFLENAAQIGRTLRLVALDHGLGLDDEARYYAQLSVTEADSWIAGWDSKLHYGFWRPVTAIRDTGLDPTWQPITNTPGHPEYPSAHSFMTGAYTEALRQFFGTKRMKVTLTSTIAGLDQPTRVYEDTDDILKDVVDARVYAGFHFRTSCIRGGIIGKKVAKYVARNYFSPLEK